MRPAPARRRDAWGRFDLLLWTAAVIAILTLIAPAWAPGAVGAHAGGSIRNVAPTLDVGDGRALVAFDANGESDLEYLIVETGAGPPVFVPLQGAAFQTLQVDGTDTSVRIVDERAHDGKLAVEWTPARATPHALRAHVTDLGGLRSETSSLPTLAPRHAVGMSSNPSSHAARVSLDDDPATTRARWGIPTST